LGQSSVANPNQKSLYLVHTISVYFYTLVSNRK
jgi:hypothetical protein